MRREAADHELARPGGIERQVHQRAPSAAPRAPARRDLPAAPRARPPPSRRCRPDFALADERAVALVDDVDLALDRDDVIAARAVDQIHERRHQRALAARARTGHEHEPFRLDRQRLNLARQAKLLGGHRAHRHHAEHAARPAMIAEAHAADAPDVRGDRKSTRSPRRCAALRRCARASASAAATRRRSGQAGARLRARKCRRRPALRGARPTTNRAWTRRAPRAAAADREPDSASSASGGGRIRPDRVTARCGSSTAAGCGGRAPPAGATAEVQRRRRLATRGGGGSCSGGGACHAEAAGASCSGGGACQRRSGWSRLQPRSRRLPRGTALVPLAEGRRQADRPRIGGGLVNRSAAATPTELGAGGSRTDATGGSAFRRRAARRRSQAGGGASRSRPAARSKPAFSRMQPRAAAIRRPQLACARKSKIVQYFVGFNRRRVPSWIRSSGGTSSRRAPVSASSRAPPTGQTGPSAPGRHRRNARRRRTSARHRLRRGRRRS